MRCNVLALLLLLALRSGRSSISPEVIIVSPAEGETAVSVPLKVDLQVAGDLGDLNGLSVCYETDEFNRYCTALSGGSLELLTGVPYGQAVTLSAFIMDTTGAKLSRVSSIQFETAMQPTEEEEEGSDLKLTGLLEKEGLLIHAHGVSTYQRGDVAESSRMFRAAHLILDHPSTSEGVGASLFGAGDYKGAAEAFLGAMTSSNELAPFRNMRVSTDWHLLEKLIAQGKDRFIVPSSKRGKVVVVSTFFRGKGDYSASRFAEIISAQTANLLNPEVWRLVLVADLEGDVDPREHLILDQLGGLSPEDARTAAQKLQVVQQQKELSAKEGRLGAPSWGQLMRVGGDLFPGHPVVFSHADIAFFETNASLAATVPKILFADRWNTPAVATSPSRPLALALTRRPHQPCLWASGGGHGLYDLPVDLCTGPHGSAEGIIGFDAFALVAPAPASLLAAADLLKTNRLGADLRMVEHLAALDFLVVDPCVVVAATHVHCTRERSYAFDDDLVTRADIEAGRYSRAVRLSGPRLTQALRRTANSSSTTSPHSPSNSHRDKNSRHAPSATISTQAVLLSFPHSGEDWVRRVVESRWGVATGSVEFNAERSQEFKFEGSCAPSDVSLVAVSSTTPLVLGGSFHPTTPSSGNNPEEKGGDDGSLRRVVSPECASFLASHQHRSNKLVLVRDPLDTIAAAFLYKSLTHRTAHLHSRNGDLSQTPSSLDPASVAATHLDPRDQAWRLFALENAKSWAAFHLPFTEDVFDSHRANRPGQLVRVVRFESLVSASMSQSPTVVSDFLSELLGQPPAATQQLSGPLSTPLKFGVVSGMGETSAFGAGLRSEVEAIVAPVACSLGYSLNSCTGATAQAPHRVTEEVTLKAAVGNRLDDECFPLASTTTPEHHSFSSSSLASSSLSLSRCVVSFSLYGDSERYTGGALANARVIGRSVLPHWRMRLYHNNYARRGDTGPEVAASRARLLSSLEALGVELVDVSQQEQQQEGQLFNGRTWRFSVASDPLIARFLIRDVDSRISPREALAVEAWVRSGRPFHTMRDHPSHTIYARAGFPMQAGMWGGTSAAVPEMLALLAAADSSQAYIADQVFLRDSVWPLALARGVLQHDSFGCVDEGNEAEPFPGSGRAFPEDFVGAVVNGDGAKRSNDDAALLSTPQPLQCRDQAPTARDERMRWFRSP